jgi:transposase
MRSSALAFIAILLLGLPAAALPAAFRWNKALVELYARLSERGKAHNIVLVACARKLLIYANTEVQRGSPWTEISVRR